jgi:hypothetical protein
MVSIFLGHVVQSLVGVRNVWGDQGGHGVSRNDHPEGGQTTALGCLLVARDEASLFLVGNCLELD